MKLVGYSDRLSVAPGDAIRFMVSCETERYEAAIVRLVHGDPDPQGPGFVERLLPSAVEGSYPGRRQELHPGSYVRVPDPEPLKTISTLTIQTWVCPTYRSGAEQALVARWSPGGGFALLIDGSGRLTLRLAGRDGRSEEHRVDAPMKLGQWYFAAAAWDEPSRHVRLVQQPTTRWPLDASDTRLSASLEIVPAVREDTPLTFAARLDRSGAASSFFTGKLAGVRLFAQALDEPSLSSLAAGARPHDVAAPMAHWHFGSEARSERVVDLGPHGLHGRAVNLPTRGVTGWNWRGREHHFERAADEYDAIHFHEDDLEDAGWEADFAWTIPDDLPSGVYAARLRAEEAEDYLPFFVRARRNGPHQQSVLLIPLLSYLAYANEHFMADPVRQQDAGIDFRAVLEAASPFIRSHFAYASQQRLLSLYDLHADRSGACYASRLRPLVTMRPHYLKASLRFKSPHQLSEDLCLVYWLESHDFGFDVLTDEQLHHDSDALTPYRVLLTGSHPEYWSEPMLDAVERWRDAGGRMMYLGGNGFYWVTSINPQRPHVIEVRRAAGTRAWMAAPGEYHHSTTGEPGGLWRHRGRPPQRLVGVGFTGQGYDRSSPYRRLADSYDPRAAFIFEGVGDEPIGDFGLHLGGAGGYEVDRADVQLGTPSHALHLASSYGHSDSYQHAIEEVLEIDQLQGARTNPLVRADIVFFETPNGGAVFSVGSISWCGSLPYRGSDNNVSRITGNVLRRFLDPAPFLSPVAESAER